MFKPSEISKLAVTAAGVLALGLASAGKAHAIVNGNFNQAGPKNPTCLQGPVEAPGQGLATGSPSAALDWSQFAVVPDSYICTDLEQIGFLKAIRVTTDGGAWPMAAMGNGFGQSWGNALPCITASFWINVVAGQVTGNLITEHHFVSQPVFKPTGGWKLYTQYASDVTGLWFETLQPTGPIPPVNLFSPPVNYLVTSAQTESCIIAPVLSDVSQYLAIDPFDYQKNPGRTFAKTRITNISNVTVKGPIHVLLEGLPQRRGVVNPDGDYFGSPFINLASGSLAPGQSEDVTVEFEGDLKGEAPGFRAKLVSREVQ